MGPNDPKLARQRKLYCQAQSDLLRNPESGLHIAAELTSLVVDCGALSFVGAVKLAPQGAHQRLQGSPLPVPPREEGPYAVQHLLHLLNLRPRVNVGQILDPRESTKALQYFTGQLGLLASVCRIPVMMTDAVSSTM